MAFVLHYGTYVQDIIRLPIYDETLINSGIGSKFELNVLLFRVTVLITIGHI